MIRRITFIAIVFAIAAVGLAIRVPAQQTTSTQTELLTEVRLLRQAIQALAGTNARVQIVFGRLQLQDQRTDAAAKRLDAAREALSGVILRISEIGEELKATENALNDPRRKAEELEPLQAQLRHYRRALEQAEVERSMRSAAEADAAGLLNQEQGRWSDLNRQLEELERALAKQQ
ncbi:MAG: hypothetical protein K2Y23_24120 [Cyanobacteria bacterium]|nr:hypothetical protein [Cyanobacteriota bacterium]